jgi:SAM-dependent methyltransferase
MASSFLHQIPTIVQLACLLKPKRVLDIGKGFGKYGMLLHEYYGVDNTKTPVPEQALREQSSVQIVGVDVNRQYNFEHLAHFYTRIENADILSIYANLSDFDLVMLLDVIEHLPKDRALPMLRHFLANGASIIISTPNVYFSQDLYESPAEAHVSFWTAADFRQLGCFVDYQRIDAGSVYLLSNKKIDVRGFGRNLVKRLRRLARAVRNEL